MEILIIDPFFVFYKIDLVWKKLNIRSVINFYLQFTCFVVLCGGHTFNNASILVSITPADAATPSLSGHPIWDLQ